MNAYNDIILKQTYRISNKTIVVIAESLVERFGINDNTLLEQIPRDDGIFLKVRKLTGEKK